MADVALGAHTDAAIITLLFQDQVGGLQTKNQNKQWVDIQPKSGAIIVNLGDIMQVWSNDRYRAAVHRILPLNTSERMSIPYFYNPKLDTLIEPIAELVDNKAHYKPFKWLEYIQTKSAADFNND